LRTNDGLQSCLVPYVRTVKTKSGATAVQFVYLSRWGSRDIEPRAGARRGRAGGAGGRGAAAGQLELDLGVEPAGGGPLPITSSRRGHLLDALERAYLVLGHAISGCQLAHDLFRP
jgi:hypothetical protein